jgi:hypothetical protein
MFMKNKALTPIKVNSGLNAHVWNVAVRSSLAGITPESVENKEAWLNCIDRSGDVYEK